MFNPNRTKLVLDLGCRAVRPDRRHEPKRFGNLGGARQWIESVIWSCKDKLSLERHGARTLHGLCAASHNACSPSQPRSGTTTTPATTQSDRSSATTTESESTI
jgi:hypothetical protein